MEISFLNEIIKLSTDQVLSSDIEIYKNDYTLAENVCLSDGSQVKTINKIFAIPYLVGAICELSTKLDEANARIAALEGSP